MSVPHFALMDAAFVLHKATNTQSVSSEERKVDENNGLKNESCRSVVAPASVRIKGLHISYGLQELARVD